MLQRFSAAQNRTIICRDKTRIWWMPIKVFPWQCQKPTFKGTCQWNAMETLWWTSTKTYATTYGANCTIRACDLEALHFKVQLTTWGEPFLSKQGYGPEYTCGCSSFCLLFHSWLKAMLLDISWAAIWIGHKSNQFKVTTISKELEPVFHKSQRSAHI